MDSAGNQRGTALGTDHHSLDHDWTVARGGLDLPLACDAASRFVGRAAALRAAAAATGPLDLDSAAAGACMANSRPDLRGAGAQHAALPTRDPGSILYRGLWAADVWPHP